MGVGALLALFLLVALLWAALMRWSRASRRRRPVPGTRRPMATRAAAAVGPPPSLWDLVAHRGRALRGESDV